MRDSESRARRHELEKVTLESGAETRAKLAALRHQLQAEHRRAQEALRDQVSRAEEAAARRIADAEGKGFEERQKLLSDMDGGALKTLTADRGLAPRLAPTHATIAIARMQPSLTSHDHSLTPPLASRLCKTHTPP